MNNTKNIELDQLYEHFNLIFDQQMELYKEWTDKNVPEEIIIWWVAYFAIDLANEEDGKEGKYDFLHNMIENYENAS